MAKDYYKILGVSRSASADEIKAAFKKSARKYHPDVNPDNKQAEAKFKELSEAYHVLSDPTQKKKYDTYGNVDFEGFPGGGFHYQSGGNPFQGAGFDFGDLNDIFGDIFSSGTSQSRSSRSRAYSSYRQPRAGKDLHFRIDLDFVDAAKGCEKKIRLSNGAAFQVKIPPGITNGAKIRLAGKGEPGIQGGKPGSLYIEAGVKDHPFFKLQGTDIYLDLPITLIEALEGAKLKIPTIDGTVEMKIPAGCQSGQKLRLKSKGILDRKTRRKGHQYVVLQIKVPEKMSAKTKKQLKEILTDTKYQPRQNLW